MGNHLGAAAFKSRLLKREHIAKTEQFYAKYGGKTGVVGLGWGGVGCIDGPVGGGGGGGGVGWGALKRRLGVGRVSG